MACSRLIPRVLLALTGVFVLATASADPAGMPAAEATTVDITLDAAGVFVFGA